MHSIVWRDFTFKTRWGSNIIAVERVQKGLPSRWASGSRISSKLPLPTGMGRLVWLLEQVPLDIECSVEDAR